MTEQADILIIGAGPTGLTLANLLGQNGVSTVLIEARDELIDYPRAVGIDDESLRAMQGLGLVDKVLEHTVPDQQIRIVNGSGKVIAGINPTTREFGWPRRNGFVQPLVDAVLLDGARRFDSVDVRMGTEAEDLVQDSDGVTVTVRAQGQESTIRAAYVVGCEGGRSFTRQKLGIPFTGETRQQRGLVIDVANDPLGTPHAVFGGDPNRGYATLSLPHGIRRWEFMLLEGEDDALVESDEFLHKLLRDHVADPSKLEIIRRRVYEHHARIADRFRDGRVLLAGDAAHVMPVVAGQGWNSCIRDALNLGWKLTAVVRDLAGQELLDTYAEERRDHVKAMVDLSVGMSKVVTNRSKVTSAVRDSAAAVIDRLPKLKSYISGQGFKPMPKYTRGVVLTSPWTVSKSVPVEDGAVPGAGTLFPQPRVEGSRGAGILLDDAVSAGWRVFVWNNDPAKFLSPDTQARLVDLDASLVQLVPSAQLKWAAANATAGVTVLGDPAGVLKSWFHARPVSAVVVRPDHVIAAECLAQDLDSTLRTIFLKAHLRPARERAAATA
ncbi:bifunctional 3-(3-hydroxy-phenyl)propionate/3-hydroxycinnamic acid hydroxylase [Arthrobacter sp. BL-252-APC-1A]|uniref:bifunctional 3-(3-hydroxy-phenyl)propionate/3-hydroxycinnamic acid hydroxylase n=1 Tax=Arthrobacter sp. BL-252-APC-1A TaxID=2606622 RepID=UPI0012B41C63|nr:bifunctional 3-(3-hydroxy-phenyl)propionate/3-hydroxycinnamic acid hydroxylase [Arthrobacter sp. BL-252-APC-1A]MSR97883.1 bifunctional 3-(3-hydroxy-phenyl)propionate/3-hydroxycinnamic acid hydroxylase [Arthrobacter sp. BL-252-APC-1A]